jgi:hypothetical protein
MPGVVSTTADFERGEVRVAYDADRTDVRALTRELERAGYPAVGPPRFIEVDSGAADERSRRATRSN